MKVDIKNIKNEMIVKFPFFSNVISNVDYIESNSIPTAGATEDENGNKKILYNPRYLETLTLEEQIFVLAHETCHLAFSHIKRSKDKDMEIWNIATDAVINASLKKENLKIPNGCVDIENAEKYDAEAIYNEYIKRKIKKPKSQNEGPTGEETQEENANQNGGTTEGEEPQEENTNQNGGATGGEESQEENTNQNGGATGEEEPQEENANQNESTTEKNQIQEENEELKNIVDEIEKQIQNKENRVNNHNMWNNENNIKKQEENTNQNENSESKEKQEDNKSKEGKSDSNKSQSENNNQSDNKKDKLKEILEKLKEAIKNEKDFEEEKNSDTKNNKETDSYDQNPSKETEDNKKDELQKEIEKISKLGENKAFEKNNITKKEQLQELREELLKQSSGFGNNTNAEVRRFKSIGRSKPLIDWRYILKETITYEVDWSYKNAYIEDGILHSALEEQPNPETEIVLDTSGSVSETLLKNFLRECKNIMEHSKIKVGCFDTQFYGFEEIRTEKDIENLHFVGFGGTDFDVAVNAFTKRVDNKIIFTDGEAYMPEKELDAIWIVYGNRQINPKGGKVIYINDEQLNKLMHLSKDIKKIKKKVR